MAALNPNSSPEAREQALAQFDLLLIGLNTENQRQGTLSAQTYATAYATAMAQADLAGRVGPTFAAFFTQLNETIKSGGEENIARLAEMGVGIQAELGKLPEFIRGQLGTEWAAAWEAFLAEPGNPESLARLQAAAARINTATQVIPENIDKLRPEVRAAILRLWAEVDAGNLPLADAVQRAKEIGQLIPRNLDSLEPEVRAAILAIVAQYEAGAIGIEEATDRIEEATERIREQMAAAREAALAAITDIQKLTIGPAGPGAMSSPNVAEIGGDAEDKRSVIYNAARNARLSGNNMMGPVPSDHYSLLMQTSGMGEGGWVDPIVKEQQGTNERLDVVIEVLRELGVNLNPDQIAALGYRKGTARAMQSDLAGRF